MESYFTKLLTKNYAIGSAIGDWTVVATKITYESKFTATASITLKNSTLTKDYDIVLSRPGLGVLLFTEEEKVALVKNLRFATRTHHWELPQETLTEGEDLEAAGRRTLREELGLKEMAVKFSPLPFVVHSAPHRSTETTTILLARGICSNLSQDYDQQELSAIKLYTLPEIEKLIEAGQITESVTLASLYWLMANKEKVCKQ